MNWRLVVPCSAPYLYGFRSATDVAPAIGVPLTPITAC